MDVKPCIIGPDLEISPGLALIPIDTVSFPAPGISLPGRTLMLLLGENHSVGLDLELCTNLRMQGKTGQHETNLKCTYKDTQFHIVGTFDGMFGDYYINPIEGGYTIKGVIGNKKADIRVGAVDSYLKYDGTVDGVKQILEIQELTETTTALRGDTGPGKIELNIIYSDEGIQVKGQNEVHRVDYKLESDGNKIEMKGITKDAYSTFIFEALSESDLHVTGTPFKVPVDYNIHLYENGVAIDGNTGFHKSEYGFVIELEEEYDEEYDEEYEEEAGENE